MSLRRKNAIRLSPNCGMRSANPLVLILVIAATVSAFTGDRVDAAIIGIIVLLSAAIDLSQSYRSQRAVEKLRAQVAPTATVLRDGEWKEIRRRDVVPGDIVRLSAGDLVPADARLLTARDLYVQQAALTGESLPGRKAGDRESPPRPKRMRPTWSSSAHPS